MNLPECLTREAGALPCLVALALFVGSIAALCAALSG